MPSSIQHLAPPSSAKLPLGTPDAIRPHSPFGPQGMLKQRSPTDSSIPPADPLGLYIDDEGGPSRPPLGANATAVPSSPIDGPGQPGGGRRGTLSKGTRFRGESWLPNGLGKAYAPYANEGEEDDPSEQNRLLGETGEVNGQVSGGYADEEDDDGGFGITIERPSTPQISSSSIFHRPAPPSSTRSTRGSWGFLRATTARLELFGLQTGSLIVSSLFLGAVVIYALTQQFLCIRLPRLLRPPALPAYEWEDAQRWVGEEIVNDPGYYARQIGFGLEEREVESEDGFFLKLQRVVPPTLPSSATQRSKPFPILIMHGLFQSSGSFITSEERSLAFWLANRRQKPSESGEEGGYEYEVWLGNTRGVFGMGHRRFKRGDPRFWDWTIRELAMYDMPALVDEVRKITGWDKIGFIGHSQGNGTAFVSLSLGIRPDLGPKLSCFVALAPAVFAGPLTHGFPFTALGKMEWSTWRRLFGVLDFIPIMTWAYDYAPQSVFAFLGYTMFAFLFDWTDTNWLARRKGKMFRFTPSPVSSASIFWWAGKGGFASRKCLFDTSLEKWFDDRFPPLSIYYGGRDFLVLTEPLLERLEEKEKDVEVIRIKKIDLSEHCDFYWAAEAVEWCYYDIVEDIERTRPPYPFSGVVEDGAGLGLEL